MHWIPQHKNRHGHLLPLSCQVVNCPSLPHDLLKDATKLLPAKVNPIIRFFSSFFLFHRKKNFRSGSPPITCQKMFRHFNNVPIKKIQHCSTCFPGFSRDKFVESKSEWRQILIHKLNNRFGTWIDIFFPVFLTIFLPTRSKMLRDVLCCWSEWISWRFVGAVSASFFLIPNKEKTNLKPAKQKKIEQMFLFRAEKISSRPAMRKRVDAEAADFRRQREKYKHTQETNETKHSRSFIFRQESQTEIRTTRTEPFAVADNGDVDGDGGDKSVRVVLVRRHCHAISLAEMECLGSVTAFFLDCARFSPTAQLIQWDPIVT